MDNSEEVRHEPDQEKEPSRSEVHEELHSLLDEGEELGNEIVESSGRATEFGQSVADLSRAARPLIDYSTDSVQLESFAHSLGSVIGRARRVRGVLTSIDLSSTASSSDTGYVSASGVFAPESILSHVPKNEQESAQYHLSYFEMLMKRRANRTEALSLMEDFGLDQPFGDRVPAAAQLEAAFDAFERPPAPGEGLTSMVLVPLRQVIETMLDHLLYLRPRRINLPQDSGPNKDWRKVMGVYKQIGRDDVPKDQAESWAEQWVDLKDELSSAKTERLKRQEVERRINRAVVFIRSLLEGLDPAKVRDN